MSFNKEVVYASILTNILALGSVIMWIPEFETVSAKSLIKAILLVSAIGVVFSLPFSFKSKSGFDSPPSTGTMPSNPFIKSRGK